MAVTHSVCGPSLRNDALHSRTSSGRRSRQGSAVVYTQKKMTADVKLSKGRPVIKTQPSVKHDTL